MTFNQVALMMTNVNLRKFLWKTVTTNMVFEVKCYSKVFEASNLLSDVQVYHISVLWCMTAVLQPMMVWKFEEFWNGKNVKHIISKGLAFIQFTVYGWTPETMEESILYPLGFLERLLELPLTKWNFHKILCFPTHASMIILEDIQNPLVLFHFQSDVTTHFVCQTTPEILAYCVLGPS